MGHYVLSMLKVLMIMFLFCLPVAFAGHSRQEADAARSKLASKSQKKNFSSAYEALAKEDIAVGIPTATAFCKMAYGPSAQKACLVLKSQIKALNAEHIDGADLLKDLQSYSAIQKNTSAGVSNAIGAIDGMIKKYGKFKVFTDEKRDLNIKLSSLKVNEKAHAVAVQACDIKKCKRKLMLDLGGPQALIKSSKYMTEKEYLRGKALAKFPETCGCFLNQDSQYKEMFRNQLPTIKANIEDWKLHATERKAKNAKAAGLAMVKRKKADKRKRKRDRRAELRQQKLKKGRTIKMAKLKAIKEKNNTPACKAARSKLYYCQQLGRAESMNMLMAFENKVGAESGYVNKLKLRNAGASKIRFKQFAEEAHANYKRIMGKSLSPSICKFKKNKYRNMATLTDTSYKVFETGILRNCGSRNEE